MIGAEMGQQVAQLQDSWMMVVVVVVVTEETRKSVSFSWETL
jgi:hypothetical protein